MRNFVSKNKAAQVHSSRSVMKLMHGDAGCKFFFVNILRLFWLEVKIIFMHLW